MKVVTNAGPLMALGKLGLVHLLHQLYNPVLVPSAVHDEVVVRGLELGQPDAYAVQSAVIRQEIVVVDMGAVSLSEAVQLLPIGEGEKQSIQLGLHESPDWILLDDLLAREEAQRLGLKVKGTLGIIAEAYHSKLISLVECELVFQAMLARDDIWIDEDLIRRVWNELKAA